MTHTDTTPAWPEAVGAYLRDAHGEPTAVEQLRGLSGARVWRVCFAQRSLIVKATEQVREPRFYQQVAPALQAQGIAIPALEWCVYAGGQHWLFLEDIPAPLPRARWQADPALLAVLRRLHHIPSRLAVALRDTFRPQWTAAMSEGALACFPEATARHLRPALRELCDRGQELFSPECWISGDPNPNNWGIRADGTLVLFDWERFGRGTPALDLAISVPGLGDTAAFQQVAAVYLQEGESAPPRPAVERLAGALALAKLWSVVEFLDECQAGAVADTRALGWIVEQFPGWVQRTFKLSRICV